MRMPFNGWFLMKSLRMLWRTGMDWLARSMRRLPRSAWSMLLMSDETWFIAEVAIFSCLRVLVDINLVEVGDVAVPRLVVAICETRRLSAGAYFGILSRCLLSQFRRLLCVFPAKVGIFPAQ